MSSGMPSEPTGYISVKAKPIGVTKKDSNSYMLYCKGINVAAHYGNDTYAFVRHDPKLRAYIDKVEVSGRMLSEEPIYTPCVIGDKCNQKKAHYFGNLLVPPNAGRREDLLSTGLIVPGMRIIGRVEKFGESSDYILASPFTEGLQYSCREVGRIKKLEDGHDVEFQGIIDKIPADGKLPSILITFNSKDNGEIMEQNREAVESIKRSSSAFWWNIEPEITQTDAISKYFDDEHKKFLLD